METPRDLVQSHFWSDQARRPAGKRKTVRKGSARQCFCIFEPAARSSGRSFQGHLAVAQYREGCSLFCPSQEISFFSYGISLAGHHAGPRGNRDGIEGADSLFQIVQDLREVFLGGWVVCVCVLRCSGG